MVFRMEHVCMCVCAHPLPMLHCFFFLLFLPFASPGLIWGTAWSSGVWRMDTSCCNWQFIFHTHPQTDCSHTSTQIHTHTLRQMVHTHTHLLNFHSHAHASLPPRQYVKQSELTWTVSLHTQSTALWQAGVSKITNWRVLLKIIVFLYQSLLQKWECVFFLIPTNFNFPHVVAVSLSESKWSPPLHGLP